MSRGTGPLGEGSHGDIVWLRDLPSRPCLKSLWMVSTNVLVQLGEKLGEIGFVPTHQSQQQSVLR